MAGRPTSVTLIAVVLLVSGTLSVLGSAASMIMMRNNPAANERLAKRMADIPVPIPIQHAVAYAGVAVVLVSGYFLLLGKNWARYLYVIWTPMQFVYYFAVAAPYRFMMIPGVLLFVVITYFLLRPPANAFFAEQGAGLGVQRRPSMRRVASFICYVFAGLLLSSSCMVAFWWSPLAMAKWMTISFELVPASVFLSMGRVLTPERYWAREIGIVLVAAAVFGALMMPMMTLTFTSPELQKTASPGAADFFSDYTTGCLWIALMGAFGGLWLLAARRQTRTKPIFAPIAGTSRR